MVALVYQNLKMSKRSIASFFTQSNNRDGKESEERPCKRQKITEPSTLKKRISGFNPEWKLECPWLTETEGGEL